MAERAQQIVEHGVRGIAVVIALLGASVGVCSFLDGREIDYPSGLKRFDSDGWLMLPFAVVMIGLGALMWKRPRPRALWVAIAISWVIGIPYIVMMSDGPGQIGTILWPYRATQIATLGAAGLMMIGGPIVAFARSAASVTPVSTTTGMARWIRGVTYLIVAIAALICICAFLPGTEIYDDTNNCFAHALGSLAGHGGGSTCESSYDQLSETRPAGGFVVVIYALWVLAPATLVYADPQRRRAWQWMIWSIAALVPSAAVLFLFEFHLDLFSRTVVLWPVRAVEAGVAAIQIVLLLGAPIAALVAPDGRDRS